jgi:[pyruvate, water dikinase]-phosphate phosphotransferase / [pyruvate, water dikinase] kinase
MHHVFVVSDGTGRTAENALRAALVQFNGANISIEKRTSIRTEEQIFSVIEEVKSKNKGFIVHTLVSDKLRSTLIRNCRHNNIETIDLMGPLLQRLQELLQTSPLEKPGIFSQLNETYFRRIETMEFAVNHDDGLRDHELDKAEIILVGVSRTFKTPLSIYLAFKGWYVANIPLVLDINPPEILFKVPPEKVFGLMTNPIRLATLRKARHEYLGNSTGNYANPDYVKREVNYSKRLFASNPKWQIITVTNKPIEEISTEIIALIQKGKGGIKI